jgi:predicted permease
MDGGLAQAVCGRGIVGARPGMSSRRGLVAAQMALSLVLVTTALLFAGGLRKLMTQDPGFRADGVVVVMADISGAKMAAAQRAPYFLRLLERLQSSSGVAAAGSVAVRPISGSTWNAPLSVDGADGGHPVKGDAYMNEVTPGYFRAMGTPLIAGRNFDAGDDMRSPKVAIVNRTFVQRYMNGANPLGRRVRRTGGLADGEFEIVGVAADAKYASLREEIHPSVYFAGAQNPEWDTEAAFVLRSSGSIDTAVDAVKRAAHDVQPRPIFNIQTLRDTIGDSVRQDRLMAALSSFYAGLAALLAGIGIYGALAYLVARRRNEIGVRMALGASRGAVVRMILVETGRPAAVGLAIGCGLTYFATHEAASLIYGVTPGDPTAMAIASVALIGLALLASFIPARRAAGIDPAAALRQE